MESQNPREPQDASAPKEKLQSSKVNVLFRGYSHNDYNLQEVGEVVNDLAAFFDKSGGEKTVFLEDAIMQRQNLGRYDRLIRKYGLAGSLVTVRLMLRLRREPTTKEMGAYADRISKDKFEEALEKDLYPDSDPSKYFLHQALDRLRARYPFEVAIESHSTDVVKNSSELSQIAEDRELRAVDQWARKDFSGALELHKAGLDATITSGIMREKELATDLETLVKNDLRKQDKGSIAIVFGGTHAPIMAVLRQKFRNNDSIGLETQVEVANLLKLTLYERLRRKEKITDEQYAQEFFEELIEIMLRTEAQERKGLSTLAIHYNDVVSTIDKVAQSLTLDQIKRVCGDWDGALALLKEHPLSVSILPYIT